MYLGILPIWVQPLAVRLLAEGYMQEIPDRLIVNLGRTQVDVTVDSDINKQLKVTFVDRVM
jgi:hypothetical protein